MLWTKRPPRGEGSPGPWARSSPPSLCSGLRVLLWVEMDMWVAPARAPPGWGDEEAHGTGPGRKGLRRHARPALAGLALYSRFLVLVALQAAHLARVHLGPVHVRMDHKFVLTDAGRGRPRVRPRAGRGSRLGEGPQEGARLRGHGARLGDAGPGVTHKEGDA